MVLLSGAEATWGGFHIGLVGCRPGPIEAPNTTLDMIPRTVAAGGFVFLAHPAAWNGAAGRLVNQLDLHRFEGLEIMNGLLLVAGSGADATPLWDGLLSAGYRLWGMANDDSHTWVGAPDAYPFTAFDIVKASTDSETGFLEALHRGSFYGSTGLVFSQLAVEGDVLQVWAPRATRLRFIGRGGRVLQEVDDVRAAYAFQGSESYVRVEALGKPLDGQSWAQCAWSQPFYVHASPCPTTNDSSSTPH